MEIVFGGGVGYRYDDGKAEESRHAHNKEIGFATEILVRIINIHLYGIVPCK